MSSAGKKGASSLLCLAEFRNGRFVGGGGYDVIGMTMQLYDEKTWQQGEGCCSLDDVFDARRVAEALSIPFVLNFQDAQRSSSRTSRANIWLGGHRTPVFVAMTL